MNVQELQSYSKVEDNNKPLYVAWGIVFLSIILGFAFANKPNQYFNFYYLLLLLFVPMYNLFRSRTCPVCGTSMKRFYHVGLPKYYYCDKDKAKIPVEMVIIG